MTSRDALIAMSRTVHEALRAWAAAPGQRDIPPWTRAPAWMKTSTEESVLFTLHHPDADAGAQHDQWVAQKLEAGWAYGKTKDEAAKTHPMMIPFDDLPEFEQRKDALVRAIVLALSDDV